MKGLVLAGGRSSRMGTPKAELNYYGEPEYRRCIKLLSSVCDEVFLSTSNFWAPSLKVENVTVLPDSGVSQGPLSGIAAAFEQRPHSAFVVLACDMPYFGTEALSELVAQRDAGMQATCFALDGVIPEPLCAIYEPSCAQGIRDALANDVRCARRALDSMRMKRVIPSDRNWVRNMNEKLNIHVHFVAQLRENAGKSSERLATHKTTPQGLYEDLASLYKFALKPEHMRVAVNDEIVAWSTPLNENDRVMFIPPVAGG